jgi:hypothetical protein
MAVFLHGMKHSYSDTTETSPESEGPERKRGGSGEEGHTSAVKHMLLAYASFNRRIITVGALQTSMGAVEDVQSSHRAKRMEGMSHTDDG